MSKKKKIVLGKNLEGYQVIGSPLSGHFVHPIHGHIDFYKMSAKQADRLIAAKFPFLKKKTSSD